MTGANEPMMRTSRGAHWVVIVIATWFSLAAAAESKKQLQYTVGPNASVSLINEFGGVSVAPSEDGKVDVVAILHSNKVEVDGNQHGNRLELRTRFLQNASAAEGRVDYQLRVPSDAAVNVRSTTGPITVQGIRSDITLEGDAANVTVRQVGGGHVHVHTLSGPIQLDAVQGNVEVVSVSGPVTLKDVNGRLVSVNTTDGKISYNGSFADGGEYSLANHSGDIDVTLPASASVDIVATSEKGTVSNDFPFRPNAHAPFQLTQGKSFAGTANSGSSSVRLRSFSGKIHVKKQ